MLPMLSLGATFAESHSYQTFNKGKLYDLRAGLFFLRFLLGWELRSFGFFLPEGAAAADIASSLPEPVHRCVRRLRKRARRR